MQAPKPFCVERPWGDYIEFSRNTPSTVKIITVNAGEALSLQTHTHRDEFWHVISGNGCVQIDDTRMITKAGDDHFVPRSTKHRIEGGTSSLVVLEISFGHADETDIVRIDDRYGRSQ